MENLSFHVRTFNADDAPGLDALVQAHMAGDDTWPPQYAREGGPARWLAERADLGRWVAVEGGHIVAHVGVSSVDTAHKIEVWRDLLRSSDDRLAEIGRLVVHPRHRRNRVSEALTRRCVRETVSRGFVPVASAFETATASLRMMTGLGWRVAGSVSGRRSGQTIVLLVAPQQLVDAARAAASAGTRFAAGTATHSAAQNRTNP